MAEWSQLPKDLLDLIAKHLNTSTDLLRFRSVCSTWRSSVAPNPHSRPSRFPILPNDGISDTSWGFYLSKRTLFRLGLPQSNIHTPLEPSSSSDGWLIKIEQDHVTRLFNPLSRSPTKTLPDSFPKRIDLLKYRVSELGHEYILQYINYRPFANSISDAGNLYMEKVALCSRACWGFGIDSYVLLTIHVSGKLAIFKFGERKWTIVEDFSSPYDDVILFEQNFYAVDNTGRTVVVNVDESSLIVNLVAHSVYGGDKKALVESNGELLLVDTFLSVGPEDDLGFDEGFEFYEEFDCYMSERTVRFKVFRLDRSEQKWVEVDSLGERMLFLGDNCTFSASASDFSGCKGNCILFTDHYFYSNREEDGAMKGRGVGVFDLESGIIGSLANYPDYSKMFWPPPTWVSSTMLEMVKKKARKEIDPAWEHCTRVGEGRMKLCCNYCKGEFWGGVLRMKHHLACTSVDVQQCPQVSEDVKNYFVEYLGRNKPKEVDIELGEMEVNRKLKGSMDGYVVKGKGKLEQQTMNQMLKKREPVIRDICRMIYANALPFNLVKDSFWKRMLVSVGEYGKGLKPPTYHEVRVSYLKREVELVKGGLEVYRKEWKETGCTLMSDSWTDGKHRNITNFLVNSPRGTVFIKSIDTSGIIKNSDKLCELLDGLVEEIGEENVVQVVTDSASAYVGAGKLLEEKRESLMWSPCAAHLLDLMLSEIGDIPVFKNTLEKAKIVSGFIYRHQWVLDLFRQFTRKKELTRPAVTRFATAYLTLKSFEETKIELRAMFRSEEWVKSSYCKQIGAFEAEEIIDRDPKFWPGLKYCMKVVLPLVKLLRLVDGDAKPAVGYIYEAMDRAKEEIAKNVNNNKSRYDKIWQIIDRRWDLQLHRPFHAAAYFLNPRFQYDESFKADMEVKRGLYITLDRFYPDIDTRIKVDAQLEKFKKAEGMFGMSLAIATRDKKQPALWWESFGEECKELQRLAIRVLSLTCSATGCERNWSTFDQVHTKRRNRLEQQRMNALVFVKYNLRLEERQQKRQERGETYDPICLSDMESDDEWITEKEKPCLPEDTSWLDIHECFQDDDEGVSRKRKKRGPRDLNARYRNKKIGDGFLVDEDEVEVIEDDEEDEEELQEVNMVESDDDDDDDDDIDIDVEGEEEY